MSQVGLLDQLERMQEASNKALGYVSGLDRAAFLASSLVQDAVVMNLIILGEAATRLMDEHPAFVQAHPLVPWRGIRGMRNRVAHGYFSLDFATVWETLEQAVPALLAQLPALQAAAASDAF